MKAKEIRISEDLCKGCYLCVWACPRGVLEISKERNRRGIRLPVAVHLDKCVVCRLCEYRCPDFAIQVITEEDERKLEEVRSEELKWYDRIRKRDEILEKHGAWWL